MAENKNIPEVRVQVRLEGMEQAQEALSKLAEKVIAARTLAGELTAMLDKLDVQLSRVNRKAE